MGTQHAAPPKNSAALSAQSQTSGSRSTAPICERWPRRTPPAPDQRVPRRRLLHHLGRPPRLLRPVQVHAPAGHGGGNLDQVIAKYEKESFEENERKLQQLRDNNVPCEKPFEPLAKSPPAPPPGA